MNLIGLQTLCHYVVLYNSALFFVKVTGLLPQVHQEGILRPYKSYADVTLFHYYVPRESSVATFEFAAFMDSPKCPVREVHIYLQHGSYPVMSADNATFPDTFALDRTSLNKLVIHSSYQSHDAAVFPVYNPMPGSWFASAYLNSWDQKVQQEGIGHKCRYSLGSVALWSQVTDVTTIPLKATSTLVSMKHFTYYKFYIPSGVITFTLKVDDCHFLTSHWFYESEKRNNSSNSIHSIPCIHNIFLRERALPFFKLNQTDSIISDSENSSYTHLEKLPYTDSYYYLMVVSETRVSYNITITVQDCPSWTLGKSLIQQFGGMINISASMKDQVMRMNVSNSRLSNKSNQVNGTTDAVLGCDCIPTFRLTRIKHAQDFSDTFLLEGKEWFTTWLALTDTNPLDPVFNNKSVLGTSFELLPFVDIGGTLSISIHLDELILNATSQVVHVNACVRKGRPPETFCCDNLSENNASTCCQSGIHLHVSSVNLSTVDDAVYVPFPEPDVYFISFKMHCEVQEKVVPCDIPEALVSIDIRTQPCVSAKRPNESPVAPCGSFGYCQEVHKGQFFYTACRCIGGYRGWACTDDSMAEPEYLLMMTTLLLTMSNLFFIPAIFLAFRRRLLTQALIYFCTMISSTLYHACDQEIYGYCLTKYSVLQFCDFFCSILAFWVTLIALARSPPQYDSVLYMFGGVVIAIGVEYNRTGLLVFIIPFAMGFAYVIGIWIYRSIKRRAVIIPKPTTALLFLPGLLLGASGLILFAFVETEENYRYTHSAWHAIIAISLLYLIPKKSPTGRMELVNNISVSELAPVNSTYQPSSASPVFFVTSELDHLVQEQTR